jgi:hypothetical protein
VNVSVEPGGFDVDEGKPELRSLGVLRDRFNKSAAQDDQYEKKRL